MTDATKLAFPARTCIVNGDAGGIEIDTTKLEQWVAEAPDREVARFVLDGLPVVSKIVDLVKARVKERMQEKKQKAMPLGDGRQLVLSPKPNYNFPAEDMREAQALFQAEGFGAEPEVANLVQERHTLELTENVCKALGFTLAKAKDTGHVRTSAMTANGTEMKKALPFGGGGAEKLQAMIDRAKKEAPEYLKPGGKLKPTGDVAGRIQDAQGGLSEAAKEKPKSNPFAPNE